MKHIITRAVNSKEYGNSQSSVLLEMIFDDLVVLLSFLHQTQKKGLLHEPFLFTNQIDYLDSIWHHFILHTKLYHDFCQQKFGEYLHHEPMSSGVGALKEDQKKFEETIHGQMNLLESALGQDFVNKIFFLYPELLKRGRQDDFKTN